MWSGYAMHFFYVYNYTDHLGNVRMSYTDNGTEAKILEENHYYPFGLKHENYASEKFNIVKEPNGDLYVIQPTERREWQYKYNGKEWQDELGLNFYDYGARNYDAAIGRWMNVDPLAELSRRWSPYTYCYDNPVKFIDPDGMLAVYDWEAHEAGRKGIYKNGEREVSFEEAMQSNGISIEGVGAAVDQSLGGGDDDEKPSKKDKPSEKPKGGKKKADSGTPSKGDQPIWFSSKDDSELYEQSIDETENPMVQSPFVRVFTHGNKDGLQGPDGWISTTAGLDKALKEVSPAWANFRKNGGSLTLILTACKTGQKGGIAQELSRRFKGLTVIAPTDNWLVGYFMGFEWNKGIKNDGKYNTYVNGKLTE